MTVRRTILATMTAMLLAGVTATAAMADKIIIGTFGTPTPMQAGNRRFARCGLSTVWHI